MLLAPGTRLGAYEVLSLIGEGGMGEVYKARDTRLDRLVAVKILSAQFAADPDRRARFEREAHAVAALNHSHICHLHDVGETPGGEAPGGKAESIRFLVMEYLEGQTLEERLVRGPLPAADVLRYAVELTDALDHAHRRGLVHRDLKPGNVMLTKAGAKLLDFGISRLQTKADLVALATVTAGGAPLTAEGAVLGTYPYMAPEQLSGREADARSDIFAFGALLYEIATGRRAFEGTTAATVIGAILHSEPPPVSALQPLTPPALDRLVARCLAKDPDDRWQTARDLMLELKWIAEHSVPPETAREALPKRRRQLFAMGSLGVLALGVAAVINGYVRPTATGSVARLSFTPPDGLTLTNFTLGGLVAVSPDGQRLAFVATERDGKQLLWTRPIDSLAAQALVGTDSASYPFWSPDSQFIGFFAQGKLKKIQASGGGPAQPLCDAIQPRGGSWSKDDVILFASGAGHQLNTCAAGGGPATPLPADGMNTERYWPQFLPDGHHYLYFGRPQAYGIFIGAVDSTPAKLLLPDYVSAVYANGYMLALVGPSRGALAGTLVAQRFDATRLALIDDAEAVADQVGFYAGAGHGPLSVSENGTLVYGKLERRATQLMWFDRTGRQLAHLGDPFGYEGAALSPNEQTIAAARFDPETQVQDLWLIDATKGIPTRLTSQPNLNFLPVWSPDGTRLVWASARGAPPNLYHRVLDGAGSDELLVKSSFNSHPTDWSRDGRFLVYASLHPTTRWDLWVLPMAGSETDRQPIRFLTSEFNEHHGRFSVDARRLAYVSDESGANEVYVQTFPKPGGKRRISTNGGTEPRWSADGKELFYLSADGTLMAVEAAVARDVDGGSRRALFKIRTVNDGRFPFDDLKYTVSGDGQRFLVSALTEEAVPSPTQIVLNWPATLNR